MGKPEAKIENYLVKQAKAHKFLCWKFISPSQNGVPDRIMIGHNKTIFVETKSETGKTRTQQDVIIETMRNHGAEVYVANTKELIDDLFAKFRKELL